MHAQHRVAPGGLVAIAVAGQLLGLAVTLWAARLLEVEQFSAYALAAALFVLLATTAPLGQEKHALRHLPAMIDRSDFSAARGLLRFGAGRTLVMACMAGLAVMGWSLVVVQPGPEQSAILVTCLALPAGALCHYGVEVVTASNRPALAMLLFRVLVPGTALLLVGMAWLLDSRFTGASMVGAWGLGWLVALGGMALAVRAYVLPLVKDAVPIRHPAMWRAAARPFLVYRLSVSMLAQSPVLMLAALGAPAAEVGIYAAAAGIAGMLTVLATATNRAYGRELGLLLGREDVPAMIRLRRQRRRWMLPLVAGLLLPVLLFPEQLMGLFRPDFAQNGQWTLRLLALANAISVLFALGPTMVKFRARAGLTYAILAAATAIQLIALLLLVPWLAATGAALATLLTTMAMSAAFFVAAWRPLASTAD